MSDAAGTDGENKKACCPPPGPKCPKKDGEAPAAVEVVEDDFKLETAPFDPRFPNTNQTKHCYVSFIDYKKCIKLRGEDFPPCEYFKRVYTSLCPNAWVEKWESQIEEGKFPYPL